MRKILALLICLSLSVLKIHSQKGDLIKFNIEKQYTQEYIDSLINVLKVAKKKRIEAHDFRKMLESNPKLKGWTYYYFGKTVLSYVRKKYDSALYYADLGIEKYNESLRAFNKQDVMMIYHYKGITYAAKQEYRKSLVCYQNAINISKDYPYKYKMAFVSGLADNHFYLGNDSLALKYYKEVEEDSVFLKDFSRVEVMNNQRIGLIQSLFGRNEQALNYYRRALKVSHEREYKLNISEINYLIGKLYYDEGNKDSTLHYFQEAEKTKLKTEEIKYDESARFGLSSIVPLQEKFYESYLKIFRDGKYAKIDKDLISIIDTIKFYNKISRKKKDLALSTLRLMYDLSKKQNRFDLYDYILKESIEISDIHYEGQFKEDLQDLETQYQTKEKEASIAQLEENKTQQEQIIKQQRIIGFSLGGLLLAFVGFGYLFWRERKLKDQYEKENLEQRLLRSQMNPHFIGNAMNIVSSLVEKKSSEAIPFINKLSNLFRLILINSREEFVSLDEELETIKGYLDLQTKFVDELEYQIKVDENIDKEEVIVSPMLIQPLVENAIKHGLMQVESEKLIEINVSVDKDSKLLLVEVKDNGIGMVTKSLSQTKKGSSVSGDVIKERLQILKKRFKVNTRINYLNLNQGTKVELYLPYLLDE